MLKKKYMASVYTSLLIYLLLHDWTVKMLPIRMQMVLPCSFKCIKRHSCPPLQAVTATAAH